MAHQPWRQRASRRLAVGLLLTLALSVAGPQFSRALAAPADASLSDVFSSLHLSPEPADYVVIVDTSASMTQDDRYGRVRAGLSRMAQALSPDDRVAIITFDANPTLRRPLSAVGSNRGAVVSSLPGSPTGQATDIGRAIGGALDLMQRSQLRNRSAVLLLTDGRIDTDPKSPYATSTSPGWGALKQRAALLQGSHDIAPLAIALTSNTDAAVLKQVFSNVTVVSSSNLGSYLSQVSTQVMKAAAISRLKGHLGDPVTASLEGVSSTGQTGAGPGKLVVHNSNPLVPVEITGLAVASDGGTLTVKGLPPSMALQPGATQTADITVTTGKPTSGTASYHVTGTVSSPWRNVITGELGLTWAPKLTSTTGQVTGATEPPAPRPPSSSTSQKSGNGPLLIVVVLVLLVTVAALGIRALRGAGPQLTGTVSVLRNGYVIDERLLRGRTMSFKIGNPEVAVNLRGTRNPDKQPGVTVSVSAGKDRTSGTLFEGDSLEFGTLSVTYTSDRTRMLRLIGTD